MVGAEQYGQKVVLVGASNLRSSACHFSSAGYDVQDLTVPGWVASPENIEKMKAKVEETKSDSNTVQSLFLISLAILPTGLSSLTAHSPSRLGQTTDFTLLVTL
jgi:hypothetical protein